MKSFTQLVESMLTTPAMPTWASSTPTTPVSTPGLTPVSTWGWGNPLDI